MILDRDLIVRDVNAVCSGLIGWSRDELVAAGLFAAFPPHAGVIRASLERRTRGPRRCGPRSTPRSPWHAGYPRSRTSRSSSPHRTAGTAQDVQVGAQPVSAGPQENLRLIDHKIDVHRGRLAAGDADQQWAPTRSNAAR